MLKEKRELCMKIAEEYRKKAESLILNYLMDIDSYYDTTLGAVINDKIFEKYLTLISKSQIYERMCCFPRILFVRKKILEEEMKRLRS